MPRTLLACDAGDRRDALRQALEAAGIDVTLTGHAPQAADLARQARCEAVLVIDSPACDATAVASSLRAQSALHGCMLLVAAARLRHDALLQAGADLIVDADTPPEAAARAVLGRLARRTQWLQAAGLDARRRSAESMVHTLCRAGSLEGVAVLRLGGLEQAAAALGPQSAHHLREAIRESLVTALPDGAEIAMVDDGAVVAIGTACGRPAEIAESLLVRAREAIVAEGREMRLRGHAGWVACPGADADAVTLIRRADSAAREARHMGRGTPMAWSDELGARLLGDLELASAMRRAVEQAQFRLVFQPQLRMDRGEPLGVEALIRWNLPDGVSVPPDRFVALAEESGLIDEIGSWSLREACREAVSLEAAGLHLRMAVNVTPRQASNPRFAEMVRHALAESGLSGSRLVLELGEQLLLHDRETLLDTMQAIRSLGVELCLDNYGSGFTSLESLRRFPVSEIKLCRDFVQPLPGNASDRAGVKAMLSMAQALGLRTTAVGIEHASQWSWLKEQGCDAAQGWLIGRPVEASELPANLAELRRLRGRFGETAPA